MKISLVLFSFVLFLSYPVLADEQERKFLLGDWGGARNGLEDKGLSMEAIVTSDVMANVRGGVEKGAVSINHLDLSFRLDTEKADLWEGGTFFVYFIGDAGESISEKAGDLQGIDNAAAPDNFKLLEGWYEQTLIKDKLSILAGFHDYNSEFDQLDFASALINSSFGISYDISQVGPSIFPDSAPAVRIKATPGESYYLQAAVYDGVPGSPRSPNGTHVRWDSREGFFWAGEAGMIFNRENQEEHYSKYALGTWMHTKHYDDFRDEERDRNGGVYFIAERQIFCEEASSCEQGLGLFFQSGYADPHRNQVGAYIGAGLQYVGLFADRDEDAFVFGFAQARNSSDYSESVEDSKRAESVFEFSYAAKLTEYFVLQPDLQYVVHPGTDASLDNALVLGLRLTVSL